ncbi:MAG: EpsG family protein, partial [Cyanobacteria bacterium P01_C01_bin.72]
MQINSPNNSTINIATHRNDKAIYLFLGLALWFVSPILGIFLLLFFVHLNRQSKSKLNLAILLTVILTITVFVSSVVIRGDLAVYVSNYELLGRKTIWEISGGGGYEFVMWLFSYPIYKLTGGSRYAFIFFWSLAINLVTFLVIIKGFSPQKYGLLALFIVATPNFIGYQAFLLRQYIATVIFLVAILCTQRKIVMWALYALSLFTHVGN